MKIRNTRHDSARMASRGIATCLLFLCLLPLASAKDKAATPEPAAPSRVATQKGDFQFGVSHLGKEIRVFGFRPANYAGGPLLVVFHGASRNAVGYRDGARELAEQLGMLLVVPEFDRKRFDVEAYQEGGVLRDGKLQPQEQWTFTYLQPMLAEVSMREGRELPYYLVGHSAGAQFLGRMAALYPNDARRMVLVNPGSLIFPDGKQKYPYGFGGLADSMTSDAAMQMYLSAPLTFYLGTGDVTAQYLSTGKQAMKQGPTRIERGRNCHAAGKRLAASEGWNFSWQLVEAEGLEHGSGPMWKHANCRLAILGEPVEAPPEEQGGR